MTMTIRFFAVMLASLIGSMVNAQDKPLVVQGTAPNLYLLHTVAPKENYYSIGRMYNTSPKEQIAPFNNLQMEKGLSPAQVLKIPLTTGNFSQDGSVATGEVLIPIYHTVAEKEGLYRISVNYNKVPLETLKKWNNLASDVVSNGMKLVIGYLKVNKELSPLANMAANVAVMKETPKTPPVVVKEPVQKPITTPPVVKNTEKEKPVVSEPVVKKDPPVAKTTPPSSTEAKPDVSKFKGGSFKSMFSESEVNGTENGPANVFKSTSGWTDGKYYCLHNTARPGTIIKVNCPSTGKTIYAKVLDAMPDIKQNAGILIQISNAAAQELGVGENKFDCILSYTK